MAELGDQEKALLRQVLKDARMARLREVFRTGSSSTDADVAEAVADAKALISLETRILYPPIEVDWDATRLGRRMTRRDARPRAGRV